MLQMKVDKVNKSIAGIESMDNGNRYIFVFKFYICLHG